ncbi:MAG TPA: nucleotidyltransferase domain-containing protein [Thermomicrobiales bacterium]|jgi:hypothetical protein|nr:nucleotidyltransferase domain-containing protein [Thermomicrobiales bacterium]
MTVTRQSALPPLIADHLEAIRAISSEYQVSRMEVFGSVMTDAFDPVRSDIDFLVTFPAGYDFGPWLGRLQDLEDRLSEVLGRDVDLVMAGALRRERFRRMADPTREVLYDASTDGALA